MEYWYFNFEGNFTKSSENYGWGVFSGRIVPESSSGKAKKQFLKELKNNKIKLAEIIQQFSYSPNDLKPKLKKNQFWIKFYKKAQKAKAPVFDVWHTYELGT